MFGINIKRYVDIKLHRPGVANVGDGGNNNPVRYYSLNDAGTKLYNRMTEVRDNIPEESED